ncbi:hypothetical protein [Haloferula sp.]|uniref:hypothetical protein n=1 Tax=Haloferula sp. TaxID=2497595 RepID=UPI00329AC17B
MTRFPIFLLLISFALSGCNTEQQSSVPVAPADSSNEALTRTLDALAQRDSDALLSTVSGGSKAQEFFASVIDSFEAIDSFREKFVAVYGDEAWTAFQAPLPEDQKRPDMNLTMPDLEQIRRDSSDWEADDKNGGVFDALPRIPLPFKQVEGGWVVDGASVFPDEETLIGFTETQKKLTEFIISYIKAIGHEGISSEDIDYQMGKDLMIVLMGGELKVGGESPNPDRFKIDEL